MTPLARVEAALEASGSRQQGRDWICPAHHDERASLSIGVGKDDRALVHCHAGCPIDEVLAALGLTEQDLFSDKGNGYDQPTRRIAAEYRYTDESGALLFEVVRFDPKEFRQRRPDGRGGWIWKLGNVRRILYRLPEVVAAVAAGEPVYVVEGEKDADAVHGAGAVATTSPGGANKWRDEYSDSLQGANVVIVQDRDDAGRKHGRRVYQSIQAVAKSIRIVEAAKGKDASDHLGSGRSIEEFVPVGESPQGDTVPGSAAMLVLTSAADVDPESVTWVWEKRIPAGKITVLDGDPGLAKSTIAIDVGARVSLGALMPDGSPGVRGAVIIASAEDGEADTIVPRLIAAGADRGRVHILSGVKDSNGILAPFTLPDDLAALEHAMGTVAGPVKLIVIDPLMAFLSAKANAHRDQDVRRALAPLASLAERTGASVLIIRHLNKTGGGNAIYRGGGSIGIVGAARSGLLVAKDPDDPEQRVLAVTKANLSKEAPALGYRIVECEPAIKIEWLGTVDRSASELLEVLGKEERGAQVEAEEFLLVELANGPLSAEDVDKRRRRAGIATRTLSRAKASLGVKAQQVREAGRLVRWEWSLPSPPAPTVGTLGNLGTLANVGPRTGTEGASAGNAANLANPAMVGRETERCLALEPVAGVTLHVVGHPESGRRWQLRRGDAVLAETEREDHATAGDWIAALQRGELPGKVRAHSPDEQISAQEQLL